MKIKITEFKWKNLFAEIEKLFKVKTATKTDKNESAFINFASKKPISKTMADCSPSPRSKVSLSSGHFDDYIDPETKVKHKIKKFIWQNNKNVTVEVINYGATITKILLPDKLNQIADIVLGCDDMKGYLQRTNPYFGATIGRVANRIACGKFSIGGTQYQISQNIPPNTLHGGFKAFDKMVWNTYTDGSRLIMTYLSKDCEEGFPGDLLTTVEMELTDNNDFIMNLKAVTTKPTYVNLTNHSYFNLGGQTAGLQGLNKHLIQINAKQITATDKNSIPTGEFVCVNGTQYDFQTPKLMENAFCERPEGFDDNYCINNPNPNCSTVLHASATHTPSGRSLELHSNQAGCQFYTANFLPDTESFVGTTNPNLVIGKNGIPYHKFGAFCFEPQNYPDAINHANFPNAILYPGQEYCHNIIYKFSVRDY